VQARIRELAASAKPTGAALRAAGTISRDASGTLQLRLVVRAGDLIGERTIDGRSCADLAGAAAVNLALLLGSQESLRPGESSAPVAGPGQAASTAPGGEAEAKAAESAPTPDEAKLEPQGSRPSAAEDPASDDSDERSTRSWRGLLDAPLAMFDVGLMPEPSLGAGFAIGLWIDRWRVLAEGSLSARQRLTVTAPLSAAADVDRLAVTLRTCRALPLTQFELAPCVHVGLRRVVARGAGAHIAARTEASMWVAAGDGIQARVALTTWLALLASADASIEGARPRISIDGVGRIGQLGPAALKIAVGPEWIL
jgi:hypothetical protein